MRTCCHVRRRPLQARFHCLPSEQSLTSRGVSGRTSDVGKAGVHAEASFSRDGASAVGSLAVVDRAIVRSVPRPPPSEVRLASLRRWSAVRTTTTKASVAQGRRRTGSRVPRAWQPLPPPEARRSTDARTHARSAREHAPAGHVRVDRRQTLVAASRRCMGVSHGCGNPSVHRQRSAEQRVDDGISIKSEMLRHGVDDPGERPDPQSVVHRHRDVVLPFPLRRQACVAARPSRLLVAVRPSKRRREVSPRYIPRDPTRAHAVMSSSRT